MSWINKKQKSLMTSARLFDINESTTIESLTVDQNVLSAKKPNQKILVSEIFSAISLGTGNIVNPYTTSPIITIGTQTSGKTYYNQSLWFQPYNLQVKTNLVYSKVQKDLPETKTITAVNGATNTPSLITRLIMRVTQ